MSVDSVEIVESGRVDSIAEIDCRDISRTVRRSAERSHKVDGDSRNGHADGSNVLRMGIRSPGQLFRAASTTTQLPEVVKEVNSLSAIQSSNE
jgi:hypothetical protein